MMEMDLSERLENALNKKRFYLMLYPAIQVFGLILIFLVLASLSSVINSRFVFTVLILMTFGFTFSIIYCIIKWKYFSKEIEEIYDLLEVDPKELGGLSSKQVLSFVNRVLSESESSNNQMVRGQDEKGPDWGRSDADLGDELERRDAIVHGTKYEGLEDEITVSEQLKRDADDRYAKFAQQRWEQAEASDPDLIEAGVESLGDLITTDFFDKNAEEGAFKKVMEVSDDEREDDR